MKVIDTSALLAYIFKEPEWKRIQKHLIEGTIAIDLIKKEALNIITLRFRRKQITEEEFRAMIKALNMLVGTNVEILDQNEVLEKATGISKENEITIYDSLFIALAKKHKCKLLTLDKLQAKIASKVGVEIQPL